MTQFPIRKIYQGIAASWQIFRKFDRHAQGPCRFKGDAGRLYFGEWFEIDQCEPVYMLDILPPLWMRDEMSSLREFLVGSIPQRLLYSADRPDYPRYFHAYCGLSNARSAVEMGDAIAERESGRSGL